MFLVVYQIRLNKEFIFEKEIRRNYLKCSREKKMENIKIIKSYGGKNKV